MSRLVSRTLLSIFMFPLAGIFYIFLMVVGMTLIRRQMVSVTGITETAIFAVNGLLTWILVAAYWCRLWQIASVRMEFGSGLAAH